VIAAARLLRWPNERTGTTGGGHDRRRIRRRMEGSDIARHRSRFRRVDGHPFSPAPAIGSPHSFTSRFGIRAGYARADRADRDVRREEHSDRADERPGNRRLTRHEIADRVDSGEAAAEYRGHQDQSDDDIADRSRGDVFESVVRVLRAWSQRLVLFSPRSDLRRVAHSPGRVSRGRSSANPRGQSAAPPAA
jgi:hypothetical protein